MTMTDEEAEKKSSGLASRLFWITVIGCAMFIAVSVAILTQ